MLTKVLLFYRFLKLVQINLIFSDNVHIMYITVYIFYRMHKSCISKSHSLSSVNFYDNLIKKNEDKYEEIL
jgi:hypothetical protein